MGLQAVVLVALAIVDLALIEAHPPEFHRKTVNAAKTNIPIAAKKVADQADRQIAYFQFEFLTAFAHVSSDVLAGARFLHSGRRFKSS